MDASRDLDILTVPEVAAALRCSKAHVHNIINGKVPGVSPLSALTLGRRRLVRRTILTQWVKDHEGRCYDSSNARRNAA